MIRNIVFDIGNVLSDFRWKEAINDCGFSEEISKLLGERIFLGPLWKEYDRGTMGDENVTAAIRQNLQGYEKEMDILYSHFTDFVVERSYAKPLILALKKLGYRIYILSNYGKTMYELNGSHFAFLPETDGQVFSYQEQLLKPDPAIYQVLFDRYHLVPSECLFVDDTPENVTGAIACGMHSAVVNSLPTILDALAAENIKLSASDIC